MTSIATSKMQAVAEWCKLFPRNVIDNYTNSVVFMKQISVIGISTITYLKKIFPEDSYKNEIFGGLHLKILKNDPQDPLTKFLSTTLIQAFDAFDKKILYRLVLCFYKEEYKSENLLEYYLFEYTYTTDGVSMSVQSKSRGAAQKAEFTLGTIRECVMNMMRTCLAVTQSSEVLPPDYDMCIRLYYNDDAPVNYQAPGFSPLDESQDHIEQTLNYAVSAPSVSTPFHNVLLKTYNASLKASQEVLASPNTPVIGLTESDDLSQHNQRIAVNSSARHPHSNSDSGELFKCPCNNYYEHKNEPYITCQYCKTKQHASCYGFLSAEACSNYHCCFTCFENDNSRVPSDIKMLSINKAKRECLCIFRRYLYMCNNASHISASLIMRQFRLSRPSANKLMNILKQYDVINGASNDDETLHKIDADRLKSILKNYFKMPDESDLVDRLLVESFASQESQPDPIGEIIHPMEIVSLKNTSVIGKVIQHVDNPVATDAAIRQYNEVTNWDKDDDMPLLNFNSNNKNIKKASKRKYMDAEDTNNNKDAAKKVGLKKVKK